MARVALITGSGGAIGRAVAIALASGGHAIAVNDVDAAAGAETVAAIRAAGGTAAFFLADVADANQVNAMMTDVASRMGELHVLVLNAGRPGPFSSLIDSTEKIWRRTIDVHLLGAFFCLRVAAKRMIDQGRGRIVAISSLAGLRGTVGSGDYAAAKAGLDALILTAAKELGEFGITCNAVAPGMVATPINNRLAAEGSGFIASALEGTPSGRLSAPEDVAALVAFLASDGAGAINGQIVSVDGGAAATLTSDLYMRNYLRRRKDD